MSINGGASEKQAVFAQSLTHVQDLSLSLGSARWSKAAMILCPIVLS